MKNQIPSTPLATRLSGSAKETERRIRNIFQGPKKRPPVWLMVLASLAILSCGGLASCESSQASTLSPDMDWHTLIDALDPLTPVLALDASAHQSYATLQADLDGDQSYETVTAFSDWNEGGHSTTLQVAQKDGTVLEYHWDEGGILSMEASYLTNTNRAAVVLEQASPISNYGAANLHVIELVDGTLVETLVLDHSGEIPAIIYGFQIDSQTDGPLAAVRVPSLVSKWHSPQWYTLLWDGTGWSLESDGCFIDSYPITVAGGMELTLALRGRWTDEGRSYYDQIQVFHGNALVQTITPDSFTPDGSWQYDGFVSNPAAAEDVSILDVNFDGAEDFGVLCDDVRDAPHCWFLWDEEARQFRYAFTLGGWLAADEENRQLTVQTYGEWDYTQNQDFDQYDTFAYDSQGDLYLADTRRVYPASTEAIP